MLLTELSSAIAVFSWTTYAISLTDFNIWFTFSVCLAEALDISQIFCTNCDVFKADSFNLFAVVSAITFPLLTALSEFSINIAEDLAASELCVAKLATSLATTAKPLPTSPALAASIDALSASKFV